jgi:glycosyltransferase involved in cell wall biosynthesis
MGLKALIDAREFAPGNLTGIGRAVLGLAGAMAGSKVFREIHLAVCNTISLPSGLIDRSIIRILKVPSSFVLSEKMLSDHSGRGVDVFISPYPKLPLFGTYCPSIHTIHDVLDLVHPAYRKRIKAPFDRWRLKQALKTADLTWFDSLWSMEETRRHMGLPARNPRVRSLGISDEFTPCHAGHEYQVLQGYGLIPGYVLAVGNGLPHKNLGILLGIADQISRSLVFVGVPPRNRTYWTRRYPQARVHWMGHIAEEHLPVLIRGAFCLAQPSTAEGYGYPPLEAMACGVPAIVSDIPVLLETTGGNTIRASNADSREWIEALESLEDPPFRAQYVERGLRWVEPLRGRKAWDKHLSDIGEIIHLQRVT